MNTATAIQPVTTNGFTPAQRAQLDRDGYTVCRGVLDADQLAEVSEEFDRLWSMHGSKRVTQHELLCSRIFISLIEHPAILDKQRELFTHHQMQLLQMDLLRQDPGSSTPPYRWHRDFVFPGDNLLSANTILYLDDIDEETGPTRVVPGTHRGHAQPPVEVSGGPLPGQESVLAKAGDATIINSAVWHTGGCNRGKGLRRAVYLYFGWWWMKQYCMERGPWPWQAAVDATPERLALLGLRMPAGDLHHYDYPAQM